jgi:hypothetical protein
MRVRRAPVRSGTFADGRVAATAGAIVPAVPAGRSRRADVPVVPTTRSSRAGASGDGGAVGVTANVDERLPCVPASSPSRSRSYARTRCVPTGT